MITKNNKQIKICINSKNPPCELRDENEFTLRNAKILRKSVISARNSNKTFAKGSALIKDALPILPRGLGYHG